MNYKEKELVFTEHSIHFSEGEDYNSYVMMDWEDSIMEASANYICEGGGDILELGFGMRISANYIQVHNIDSHTIVEIHPDILNNAYAWAEGKANVSIVAGDWYSSLNLLTKYDGILLDTYGDKNIYKFKDVIASLSKPGCKITWWNNSEKENTNTLDIEDVTYEALSINPPTNDYFNNSIYYLPKKQF